MSDDLEMGAVVHSWGVAGGARRFLGAGGDLALVCRGADARRATVEALAQDVARGVLDLAPAVRRRQAALRLIESAGPRRMCRSSAAPSIGPSPRKWRDSRRPGVERAIL